MGWQNDFKNLDNERAQKELIREKEQKRKADEMDLLVEEFGSRIESVCKEFSKSIKWKIKKDIMRDGLCFHLGPRPSIFSFLYDCGKDLSALRRIDVEIKPYPYEVSFIRISSSVDGVSTNNYENLLLREFTEARLAKILKESFLGLY